MSPAQTSLLAAAMDRLWKQYLPELEKRVSILQSAAAEANAGTLSADLCKQAHFAAHKLAGVLGTFGLAEGTSLAREAENFYSGSDGDGHASLERIAQIPVQLRALLAARR